MAWQVIVARLQPDHLVGLGVSLDRQHDDWQLFASEYLVLLDGKFKTADGGEANVNKSYPATLPSTLKARRRVRVVAV